MPKETILVTHGFGGHWLVMLPLCRKLRTMGYNVINWGYRSLWKDNQRHAEALREQVEKLEQDESIERFHLVAHSMGNILVRVMLRDYQPTKLGRIVMITPPNKGSHVATKAATVFGWLSTTLKEIRDTEDSLVNQLDHQIDPDYEVGIIQAMTDLVVHRPATKLEEAKEYILLPGFHSSVLLRQSCAEEVDDFLSQGSFNPESQTH
ncbi:MAG: alpha/beta fold hydrolase [Planctomycetota bacterium]